MEINKNQSFEYFDPDWLSELSHSDTHSIHRVIESFVNHLPDMLDDVEVAVNQRSTTKLRAAMSRVIAISSLFTRHDFGSRFNEQLDKDGPISPLTLKVLSDTIHELNQLKKEVIQYQNSLRLSQIEI